MYEYPYRLLAIPVFSYFNISYILLDIPIRMFVLICLRVFTPCSRTRRSGGAWLFEWMNHSDFTRLHVPWQPVYVTVALSPPISRLIASYKPTAFSDAKRSYWHTRRYPGGRLTPIPAIDDVD